MDINSEVSFLTSSVGEVNPPLGYLFSLFKKKNNTKNKNKKLLGTFYPPQQSKKVYIKNKNHNTVVWKNRSLMVNKSNIKDVN